MKLPLAIVAGATALSLCAGCTAGDTRATIRLAYGAGPAGRALLEDGMKVNISHVDVHYTTRWNERGGARVLTWRYTVTGGYAAVYTSAVQSEVSEDGPSAALWVNAARSKLAAMIDAQARQNGIQVVLVDREHLGEVLHEQDLAHADIVESPRAPRPKVLDVDVKIYGQIDVDVKLETGTRKTIQGIQGGGGYVPWGWHAWGRIYTGDRQKIRRIMTFQAQLTMEDARTGRIWALHAASWQPIDTEKPGVFFGADKHPIDFKQPDDALVMAFFEREIPNFIAKLLPARCSVEVTAEASRNKNCVAAVKELAVGQYASALDLFEVAIQEEPNDHRARFGSGVACEALGDLPAAAEHYRQADLLAKGKAPPAYAEARRRVAERSSPGGAAR